MAFVDPGNSEAVKGAVHGGVLTLAILCGVYNFSAWKSRPEKRLLVNAIVYGALMGFEVYQTLLHKRACDQRERTL
jgi:hypothetical protein